jgi:hypothetical protein
VALILAQLSGQAGTGAVLTAKDHDVEAGRYIAQEAGASVTQFGFDGDGERRTVTVVATDRQIHDALVALVRHLLERHGGGTLCSGEPDRP